MTKLKGSMIMQMSPKFLGDQWLWKNYASNSIVTQKKTRRKGQTSNLKEDEWVKRQSSNLKEDKRVKRQT